MKRRAPAQRSDTTWTDADTLRLQEGLQRLSVTLEETAFVKVVQWARLLKQWNRTFNLLGNSDSVHLIDEHLLDSLAIVPVLERDDRSEERRVGKECRSRWSPYH